MDHQSIITPADLECLLCDETAEPQALPLSLLEKITDGFSNEQEIARGGFAVVYKGKLINRTVAVKRMSDAYMDEKVFHREVQCLMMGKHKNIVRFLGYCADRQGIMEKFEGKLVMADVHQRLLCFEYLPNGSLHEYITGSTSGLQWRDRYHIIKGICQGLHYLHHTNIVHLDLKPGNILLDGNLVAKIADFGLSRCFDENQSRIITKNIGGTWGYLAPEFCNGEITCKFDIFSLGVIIMEILTGKKGYHDVDKVVDSWSNRLEEAKIEVVLEQVRVCADIGMECVSLDPAKRPDIQHIISRLDGTESLDKYIKTASCQPNNLDTLTGTMIDLWSIYQEFNPNVRQYIEYCGIFPIGFNLRMDELVASKSIMERGIEEKINPDMWIGTMHAHWLRYQQLNLNARRCIEYCSIFPRGSMWRRNELVFLWIAQGFVRTSCATEDMEHVADGYVQELVSCSFLQQKKTWDGKKFFTIDDVLHEILYKVVGNCFIIMNERSHGGEGWQGDVPQDIQHLFIQNYDGELITEKILGLENVCTLIINAVGRDTHVEEKVIDHICKKLTKLRVLAFFLSEEYCPIEEHRKFSVPESVGQLKNLRYFAFKTSKYCKVILPSTINKLENIQLLDFGDGDILEFTFGELVNLRRIFCSTPVCLSYLGRLISLETIPCAFTVSNEQGYEVNQLRDLNKLRGYLCINGLEYVKSKEEALEANLAAKEHITELELNWGGSRNTRCSPEVEANVLEGMCPPVGLQRLAINGFRGSRYPDWMEGKQNGGPKNLQELHLWKCSQSRPAPQLVEAFPCLRVLLLWNCALEDLPRDMQHLTSLKSLSIYSCKNIRSLPTLPLSLKDFLTCACNDELVKSCKTVGHPNWQKIKHIPYKSFS